MQTWTVARLLGWTREFFQRHGVDAPRLSAEILLAHALGCDRIELYTRPEHEPDRPTLDTFRAMVRRAAEGEPTAYLIGYKEFFSLRFAVTPDVLIPRPETEILVERIISFARDDSASITRILDVGCGSGCIAISVARHLAGAHIFASDVSEAALAVARQNAENLGVADRITFRSGDLLAPWADAPPFDAILSNPPYIATRDRDALPATVRDFEPPQALFAGDDGLALIRRLAAESAALLRPGGHLMIEIAYDQAAGARKLLDDAGWASIVAYKDMGQHERVLHARRGAAGTTQVA